MFRTYIAIWFRVYRKYEKHVKNRFYRLCCVLLYFASEGFLGFNMLNIFRVVRSLIVRKIFPSSPRRNSLLRHFQLVCEARMRISRLMNRYAIIGERNFKKFSFSFRWEEIIRKHFSDQGKLSPGFVKIRLEASRCSHSHQKHPSNSWMSNFLKLFRPNKPALARKLRRKKRKTFSRRFSFLFSPRRA